MYYPILRSKLGELNALGELKTEDKKLINPILQIIPDPKTSKKLKDDPDIHWDNLAGRINKLKDLNRVLLDVTYISDDLNSFIQLVSRLDTNMNIQPVIYPNSSDDYVDYVGEHFPGRLFLRIKSDFTNPRLINDTVNHYMKKFNVDASQIELLIDYRNIDGFYIETIIGSFQNIINNVTHFGNFNGVIVSSGCFPIDVSDFKVNKVSSIPRLEWELYNELRKLNNNIHYSDYTNVNPVFNPYAQAFLGSCTLKYTADNEYYIFRGSRPDNHPDGNDQYYSKCDELVGMSIYSGRDYSAGDKYINGCAKREKGFGPGNALTWVRVTQNHHFTKVINQLKAL